MKLVNHHWKPRDIVGGNLALNLVNTLSGWNNDPEDWVPDITSFLVWAGTCGVLDTREQNEAARHATDSPVAAERVLASVKELRFALWSLIGARRHQTQQDRLCNQPGYLSAGASWPPSDRGGPVVFEKSSCSANQDLHSPRLRLEVCGPIKEQITAVVRHGCL